jgi:hypothetical protein
MNSGNNRVVTVTQLNFFKIFSLDLYLCSGTNTRAIPQEEVVLPD